MHICAHTPQLTNECSHMCKENDSVFWLRCVHDLLEVLVNQVIGYMEAHVAFAGAVSRL